MHALHYLHATMKNILLTLLLLSPLFSLNAQNYEQRKLQYMDSVMTNDYEDAIMVQAFQGDPINQQRLDEIYSDFGTRSTIDFALVELVRVMYLTDGSYDIQIREQMETLPYWINDGDTLHNHWTENHMIMWMSCEWLMHERHGWEIDDNLKKRLLHYLNLKLDVGFYEFFSSTYFPFTLSGLMNLADFAEDQEIRDKSEAVARKLLTNVLMMVNSEGVLYPAAGRNYAGKYLTPYGQTHNAILYLISGRGPCPSSSAGRADFFATSNIDFSDIGNEFVSELDTVYTFGYSPEESLVRHDTLSSVDELMMQWSSGMYFHPYVAEHTGQLLADSNMWDHVNFTDFSFISDIVAPSQFGALATELDELTVSRTDCGATVAIYKNDETVLTSIQDYWKGKIGFQQWPIAANVGGTAVYMGSGPVEGDWQARNNSNFNEHLPYVSQNSNVALIMYRPQAVSSFLPFGNKDVALHWIDDAFDSIDESDNWIFGSKNDNYIAVRRACVGEINGVRACETDGGQSWVFIVGNDAMYNTYSDFQNLVGQTVFTEEWTTDLSGDSTYYASVTFDGNTIDHTWGTVPAFTSVDEQEPLGKLNVYPNPSQGVFQVNIPNSGAEPIQLEVFDTLGNLVVSETISNSQTGLVDLRSQANGSYLIRVIKADAVWTGRLLKLP
ncbi:MAG: hypothetical protein ACJAYA_000444 [Bacteroidia bacterium]|jgi:hypothetical protein